MTYKRNLFLALILLVFIISISAANATEDITRDINANDNQEIILDEEIKELASSSDNQDIINEENKNPDSLNTNENPNQDKGLEESEDTKVLENKNKKINEKSKSIKENKKSKNTKKEASNKKKSTFKTISKGSKDKNMVKKIQKALKKNGYYLRYKGHYLMVDGHYGPCTFRSVKQFQKAKKLKVTGKVDEKTAIKLKIFKKSSTNVKILFEDKKTFEREYNSGYSFEVKIIKKNSGKGIATLLNVDYLKNGKKVRSEGYYTDKEGINYITPDYLKVGTYTAKVSPESSRINANPVTKKIIVKKTSINLKAKSAYMDSKKNIKLKASLVFKNNANVNEGKVKFIVGGKSYIVKVKKGLAIKNLKLKGIKSKEYTVKFLGNKNIKACSASGKIY